RQAALVAVNSRGRACRSLLLPNADLGRDVRVIGGLLLDEGAHLRRVEVVEVHPQSIRGPAEGRVLHHLGERGLPFPDDRVRSGGGPRDSPPPPNPPPPYPPPPPPP